MKNSIKKEILEKAITLMRVIDERKSIEKEEKELKEFFKSYLSQEGEAAVLAGNVLIIISEKERASLDTDLMKTDGIDLKKYEKKTKYQQVDVKVA